MSTPPRLDRPLARELGPTGRALEKHLGLRTVGDLLHHFPRRYARRGELTDIASLVVGEVATVFAEVVQASVRPMRQRRGQIVQVTVTDGHRRLKLTFFTQNRGIAEHWARQLSPGTQAMFSGKVDSYRGELQLVHPEFEVFEDADESLVRAKADELIPVYPAALKLPSMKIAKAVQTIVDTLGPDDVPDPVPPQVLRDRALPSAADAMLLVHRPTDDAQWRRAQKRFKFEEALVLQTALARRRASAMALPATPRPAAEGGLLAAFDERLPFDLTEGQRQVGEAIAADLAAEHPMHRLLQGEVGSGKTVVALRAMLTVVDSGGQAALLAPTEVLAMQHHRTITAMLGDLAAGGMLGGADNATRVALLTGSQSTAVRKQALLDVASGAAGIVVGTHALLQEKVEFADLGLVVVDEQHRFGVEQRDALRAKAIRTPHLLVMTATPIPRTVAMTVFGDLETSTLRELPRGRQPIATHVVPSGNERWMQRTWSRVREEVDAGRQVFVVCPRIGEPGSDFEDGDVPFDDWSDRADTEETPDDSREKRVAVSALETYEHLTNGPALAGLRVGLLHGRLAPDQKDATMQAFAAGEIDVLVCTTVIEVGVDVPNASVMVVLDADWFGVSQLHQLRGRVGRGAHPGLCLLVSGAGPGTPAWDRLQAVASTVDGFKLSQIDLENRREGDVLGSRQSGFKSSLRLLRVLRDADLIADARDVAADLVAADPDLTGHPELAEAIERLLDPEREVYLERG
ncbi:MAG TPA: ATP-dependent DNA helicase RecG [Actinomycetales bacterium]|nr:ATP-dependent DNA helicase RecG [Actinomycetales bacterium]